jgi:hypothetical protein
MRQRKEPKEILERKGKRKGKKKEKRKGRQISRMSTYCYVVLECSEDRKRDDEKGGADGLCVICDKPHA